MVKRIVVLLLALALTVSFVACKKKVDNEIPDSSSSVESGVGVPNKPYDEGEDLTSSELEQLESEIMTESNVEIVVPGSIDSDTSSDSSDSDTSSGSTSSSGSSEAQTSSNPYTNFH